MRYSIAKALKAINTFRRLNGEAALHLDEIREIHPFNVAGILIVQIKTPEGSYDFDTSDQTALPA